MPHVSNERLPTSQIDKRLSFDNLLSMTKIVNLKAFREDVDKYIKIMEADEDQELVIMKRSKALFKITPPVESTWETMVDFTEYYPGGIPAEEALKIFDDHLAKRKAKKNYGPSNR